MNIVLSTNSVLRATTFKTSILQGVQKQDDSTAIETWSYKKSSKNYDTTYHDLPLYIMRQKT